MPIASGARTRLTYIKEVTQGVTPASPTMKVLRSINRNINLAKNTIRSNEIRSDRQIAHELHGFNRIEGSIGTEFAAQAYDEILEGVLSSAWAAAVTTSGVNLSATTSTFVRASGSFITEGYKPGDMVISAGFSNGANNGTFRATVVNALDMTVDATLVVEAAGAGKTIAQRGKTLQVGTVLNTYTLEREFQDISKFEVFRGVTFNQMSLSVRPGQIATATYSLLGMSAPAVAGTTVSTGGTPTEAATNAPFVSFDGKLYENGTVIAVVTGIDIDIVNGRTIEAVVGSNFSPAVFEGTCVVTGTMTAFFENSTVLDKFRNETDSNLWLLLNDLNNTDFISIVLPKVVYTGGAMDPPREGPVPIVLPFTAVVDAALATSIRIQRGNT
jgi:hypothetical protein